jgi:hypothetical protein
MAHPAPDYTDPFAPYPKSNVLMECLQCGSKFEERLVTWRKLKHDWLWCCPTAGCDGTGIGYDIFPVKQRRGAANRR